MPPRLAAPAANGCEVGRRITRFLVVGDAGGATVVHDAAVEYTSAIATVRAAVTELGEQSRLQGPHDGSPDS